MRKKIRVNKSDHSFRRRFTIAHELGHFLMHKDLRKEFIERRSPIAKEKPWYEQEADAFAAHLLVPLEFLKEDSRNCLSSINMQNRYQVSDSVIGY